MPGEDAELANALTAELRSAGYAVVEIGPAALCDPAKLSAERFDLLVVPDAGPLPAASMKPVENYLRGGGDIIALNTPMWQRALINMGGRWLTRGEYQVESAGVRPRNVLFEFGEDEMRGWQRASDAIETPTLYETVGSGPAPGQRALHVSIPRLTSWDTLSSPKVENAFPAGHTLTVFSAKGGPNTSQLAVEWTEKDGSRWIATVPLTTEWRRYVLTPNDFRYWHSVPNRGGRGDGFRPENAQATAIGLALTHTEAIGAGKHEYWVGPFGTAQMTPEYEQILSAQDPPALDTLSPSYKLFSCSEVGSIVSRSDQALIEQVRFVTPEVLRSPHPRPRGGGFEKGRDWRWIPLLEARSASGEWRGTPATLTIHTGGPFKGGVWASFGIGDGEWYRSPEAIRVIGQVARRMREGVFIGDAGSNFYTYFAEQPLKLGVRAVSTGKEAELGLTARITVTDAATGTRLFGKDWPVSLVPGESQSVSDTWRPVTWPTDGLNVTAEVLSGGEVIDRVVHEAHVWTPKEEKRFVTIRDGDFALGGKRWRAHGINYMPSSGIGTEDGEYFEHWIGARSYDPETIQRDLEHIKDLGFNSVSIFIYSQSTEAQNLLDLLRRLDGLGLKANLSLRPGTPMDFLWPQIRRMIEYYRLWDNDTVFAYDLAWEPSFGTNLDRAVWDEEWERWIVERYGSIAGAEKDWGFAVPRDEAGKITNPLPHQIDTDGDWRRMTAAYRRFLDTLLYKKYGEARRLVLSIDPNHYVSFRMAEAANPDYRWGGRITYDFPYLAAAVDFLAPEAYGRIGTWERVRAGWFQAEYARWAAPKKPVIWAEAGVSTWDLGRMVNSQSRLDYAAESYENFYRLLINTAADGVFFWWYPGGFRYGENSDYGVINPDGTDRRVTRVIREQGPEYLAAPPAKPVDHFIEIDRDRHPAGVAGIYDAAKEEFWRKIDEGRTPGLRTAGTGSTSANCPLTAVGNTPCSGANPPKYLDGAIDSVEILAADDRWTAVRKGGSVQVRGDRAVVARISLTNLGEAEWVTRGKGLVYVTVDGPDRLRTAVPAGVRHLDSVRMERVVLSSGGLKGPTDVTISLAADRRTAFGERFRVTLQP